MRRTRDYVDPADAADIITAPDPHRQQELRPPFQAGLVPLAGGRGGLRFVGSGIGHQEDCRSCRKPLIADCRWLKCRNGESTPLLTPTISNRQSSTNNNPLGRPYSLEMSLARGPLSPSNQSSNTSLETAPPALAALPRAGRPVGPTGPETHLPDLVFQRAGGRTGQVALVRRHRIARSRIAADELLDGLRLPAGALQLSLLPKPLKDPAQLPAAAPRAAVPETMADFYLLVTHDPSNEVSRVRMQVIDAGADKLRAGQMLWFNISPNLVGGMVGSRNWSSSPPRGW